MYSDIEICNKALVSIGCDPISSFSDQTRESDVARVIYPLVSRAQLCKSHFGWTCRQETLEPDVAVPEARWDRAYKVPTDCLKVWAFTLNDIPIKFDRFQNYLYANLGESDQPVLDYTFNSTEDLWPDDFVEALVEKLGAWFARGITRNAAMAKEMRESANKSFAEAAHSSSQGRTSKALRARRLIGFR